jgi:hypothetical protein
MIHLCSHALPVRGKYKDISEKRCYKEQGHAGACEEFHYLSHLSQFHKRVADKIKRDATKTTGAAWSSEEAGPNRIDRWVMLQPDEVLLRYGLDMSILKQTVVAKLREKAAPYSNCMDAAVKLTWLAYQMPDAPECPPENKDYLERRLGLMNRSSTTCIVCRLPLSFTLFMNAQRGKAEIETAHSNPRAHNSENIGFAHRECNIAQGSKTLDEFYAWIAGIIERT